MTTPTRNSVNINKWGKGQLVKAILILRKINNIKCAFYTLKMRVKSFELYAVYVLRKLKL